MITIPEVAYWTPGVITVFVIMNTIVLASIVVFIVGVVRDWHPGLVVVSFFVAAFIGVLGNLYMNIEASDTQAAIIAHSKVEALEELGYDEVTLDRYGSYIASKDGEFVRLYLESTGNRTYEVLEGKKP